MFRSIEGMSGASAGMELTGCVITEEEAHRKNLKRG